MPEGNLSGVLHLVPRRCCWCRRPPTLALLQAPPAVGPAPSTTAAFVLAVVPAVGGLVSNVSAVVTDDAGSVVATLASGPRGVLTVAGLVPGVQYTLRASCVDALGGTCAELVHRWRTPACPALGPDTPVGLQAIGIVPGERFVSWASPAATFEYSLNSGPWLPVAEAHPGVTPLALLVSGSVGWCVCARVAR